MNSQHDGLPADAEKSVLVVVDIQEKLFPLMHNKDALNDRVALLMQGASRLGVPILITEQYVQGLGATIPTLGDLVPSTKIEKTTFSCFGEPAFREALRQGERTSVVLCGIESHICVMQTALDAIAEGYDVFVVEDAVSSRLEHVRELGIQRMRQAGAITATAEGMLFEWLGRCDRSEFKDLLPLFKESR
ncbi:MAG: nicotinamidase-related amidase [Planctomycetota bacterium]